MKIPLSARLRACCNYIPKGTRVADVGTDHGYLGIWLLQQGIASSIIASDIVPGPLSTARRNAVKYGFADKMEFYLSDGVRSIPRDFDVMVCAGMGADTMVSILSAAQWLKSGQYTLVLQCQSKTPMLRRYLSENGWRITEETVVQDGKFLYTVMDVCWQPDYPRLTPGQWYFPPALLKNPAKELPAYYSRVLEGLRLAAARKTDPQLTEALAELSALEQVYNRPKEAPYDNG
ncbi:MAG: SAM-dependent methyltransferase [Oscillospiraceae bacterium]|nr:SAM-dependent methyltransferase [Oscillospiraceae bacterium]